MDPSLLAAFSLGLLLGIQHALDPDHLIAVSTIVSEHKNFKWASLIGAFSQLIEMRGSAIDVHAPSIDVPRRWFEEGNYSIEVAGKVCSARPSLRPLFDPDSERLHA